MSVWLPMSGMSLTKTNRRNKMENAQELASKVASFIKYNKIDTTEHSMEEIVKGYFMAQLEAIDKAGEKALENLI